MADDECWNVEWVAENGGELNNGGDLEWARGMWFCPCRACVAWPAPVPA